jgi:hypothetical protein
MGASEEPGVIGRLLYGSLSRRAQPLLAIALAATVAAGTLAAAAGLGSRLSEGAAAGLHASGPNLLVRPQVGGPERLPAEEIARVLATPGVLAAAGIAVEPNAAELVAGADGTLRVLLTPPGEGSLPVFAASEGLFELRPTWEVDPATPASAARRFAPGSALVGALVAGGSPPAGRQPGAGDLAGLPVAGIVTTGDEPDRGVIVPLADLARMKDGMAGEVGVDRIEVRARYDRLEETVRAIEARVAGAEARSLARVTVTETTMAEKIQHLMIGVGAVCLLLALATVGSATLALLEERRREMALFLALGYTGRWVQGLLTAELALVGLVSVVAGGLLGEGAAAALARTLLGAGPEGAFAFRPSVAGLAAGCLSVAVLVALAAAVVRFRVERLDPAPVLQGR